MQSNLAKSPVVPTLSFLSETFFPVQEPPGDYVCVVLVSGRSVPPSLVSHEVDIFKHHRPASFVSRPPGFACYFLVVRV